MDDESLIPIPHHQSTSDPPPSTNHGRTNHEQPNIPLVHMMHSITPPSLTQEDSPFTRDPYFSVAFQAFHDSISRQPSSQQATEEPSNLTLADIQERHPDYFEQFVSSIADFVFPQLMSCILSLTRSSSSSTKPSTTSQGGMPQTQVQPQQRHPPSPLSLPMMSSLLPILVLHYIKHTHHYNSKTLMNRVDALWRYRHILNMYRKRTAFRSAFFYNLYPLALERSSLESMYPLRVVQSIQAYYKKHHPIIYSLLPPSAIALQQHTTASQLSSSSASQPSDLALTYGKITYEDTVNPTVGSQHYLRSLLAPSSFTTSLLEVEVSPPTGGSPSSPRPQQDDSQQISHSTTSPDSQQQKGELGASSSEVRLAEALPSVGPHTSSGGTATSNSVTTSVLPPKALEEPTPTASIVLYPGSVRRLASIYPYHAMQKWRVADASQQQTEASYVFLQHYHQRLSSGLAPTSQPPAPHSAPRTSLKSLHHTASLHKQQLATMKRPRVESTPLSDETSPLDSIQKRQRVVRDVPAPTLPQGHHSVTGIPSKVRYYGLFPSKLGS